MPALMIDAETSRDRDDAFSVARVENGWRARVFVADVAGVVSRGSEGDQRAGSRGQTVYGARHTVPMLGPQLEQEATLRADADRSAIAITMDFDRDGYRTGLKIGRVLLKAGTCVAMSHTEVVAALGNASARWHRQVVEAAALAQVLAAERSRRGAFVVYDTVHGLVATENGVLSSVSPGTAAAHAIVQELMVAANRAVAEWAVGRGLPLLFRNHRRSPVAPDQQARVAELSSLLSDPAAGGDVSLLQARVNLTVSAAVYEATVDGHYGLQVAAYTHVTSPLRRYADLINQRIVLAAVDGATVPYTPTELAQVAAELEALTAEKAASATNAYKERARKEAAAAIAADALRPLSDKEFSRVLKVALRTAPAATVVAELVRRAEAEALTAGQVSLLFTSDLPGWVRARGRVLAVVLERSPSLSMSVWSARAQILKKPVALPDFEVVQAGPSHAPVFAVRARSGSAWSGWEVSSTKKVAEQAAGWRLLQVLGGHAESAASDAPVPAEIEIATAAAEAEGRAISAGNSGSVELLLDSAADDPGAGLLPDGWLTLLGSSPEAVEKKRRAAAKNPRSWLNSMIKTAGGSGPRFVESAEGPSHRRVFTVQIVVGPVEGTARAATVKAARNAAAEDVVAALFRFAEGAAQ